MLCKLSGTDSISKRPDGPDGRLSRGGRRLAEIVAINAWTTSTTRRLTAGNEPGRGRYLLPSVIAQCKNTCKVCAVASTPVVDDGVL